MRSFIRLAGTTMAALCVLMAACKKEKPEAVKTVEPIYGFWKVTELHGFRNITYLDIYENGSSLVYLQDTFGFRSYYSSTFQNNELVALKSGFTDTLRSCQYIVQDHSLLISYNGSIMIKAERSAPAEINNWFETVTPVSEISGIFYNNRHGIGSFPKGLLMCDGPNLKVVQIDSAIVAGPLYLNSVTPSDVEFDGTYFWVTSPGYSVCQYDLFGGTAIDKTSSAMGEVRSLSSETGKPYLWCMAANDSLYRYQKFSHKIIAHSFIGRGFSDLSWIGGKLYLSRGGFIYRINPIVFAIEKTYRLNGGNTIYGIANNNNSFWLNTGNHLLQVKLN